MDDETKGLVWVFLIGVMISGFVSAIVWSGIYEKKIDNTYFDSRNDAYEDAEHRILKYLRGDFEDGCMGFETFNMSLCVYPLSSGTYVQLTEIDSDFLHTRDALGQFQGVDKYLKNISYFEAPYQDLVLLGGDCKTRVYNQHYMKVHKDEVAEWLIGLDTEEWFNHNDETWNSFELNYHNGSSFRFLEPERDCPVPKHRNYRDNISNLQMMEVDTDSSQP